MAASSSGRSAGRSASAFVDALTGFLLALFRPIIRLLFPAARNQPKPGEEPQRDDPESMMPSKRATQKNGRAGAPAPSSAPPAGKENQAPAAAASGPVADPVAAALALLRLNDPGPRNKQGNNFASEAPAAVVPKHEEDPVKAAEKAVHYGFMDEALEMARLALRTNETPVGCVLVHKGRIIARGMNATNVTRNGTRHAELMALCAVLSYTPQADMESPSGAKKQKPSSQSWGDVDPKDGHLYPYGQKLHPSPKIDQAVIRECVLYVTVEPCVMCASMLRQFGIRKVYFGAVNDKFGGTGGVFSVHQNSDILAAPLSPSLRPARGRIYRPPLLPKTISNGGSNGSLASLGAGFIGSSSSKTSLVSLETESSDEINIHLGAVQSGDGGNVEPGYEVEGGWGRDEAVNLLRQFYVQENGRAPIPRKKEGRAARLAAILKDEPAADDAPNDGDPASGQQSGDLPSPDDVHFLHGEDSGSFPVSNATMTELKT